MQTHKKETEAKCLHSADLCKILPSCANFYEVLQDYAQFLRSCANFYGVVQNCARFGKILQCYAKLCKVVQSWRGCL